MIEKKIIDIMSEKDLRFVRKEFQNDKPTERIRLGNKFVDDFIFEGQEAADIPINALRVIFNIISIIGNEQFRPEDRPRQLKLFDQEFETENNVFALMKIRNSKISPSGSTRQVIEAYEFLVRFKMDWYRSVNSSGKEIRTFGGLISAPSYEKRGYTYFLISSYWLKKLIVIPEYNYVLYNLVYNIKNNKHILFAIWLAKVPLHGTTVKLSSLNKKFGLNYKTSNDFCFKFLKLVRRNLDLYGTISFNYKYSADNISIIPYDTRKLLNSDILVKNSEQIEISKRLQYFKRRYNINDQEYIQFSYQYKHIPQTKVMVDKAYKVFIRRNRLQQSRSSDFKGKDFLIQIQNIIIEIYKDTKMGRMLPNGYPVII